MKYASDELKSEHEGILLGLKILEKMAGMAKAGKTPETGELAGIVDFLKLFADTCHHGKEENLLFVELEKYGIPNKGGPIGQMLSEHAEGRTYIAGMSRALENGSVDAAAFSRNAENYIGLLRNHIQKENNVLFPLGDKAIPPDVQARLLEDFERHEETVMGAGTHERLHRMLDSYGEKYL